VRMDVETYKAQTARLQTDDLDFRSFRDHPLPAGALRCLRYMHDVEHHTVCYLRDLLVTSAHRDPTITTFLTFWNFEEFWHGEALAAVLAAHDEPSGLTRIRGMRDRLTWKDRVAPMWSGIGSAVAGESFTAVHMTWGAINEWCTQAGYSLLSAKADHPVLRELLRRIMKQEGRHIDFYASEAHRRLESDKRAQRLTRLALRRFWKPVGATVMPRSELAHLIDYLFADGAGRDVARRIDRRVDKLPGLSGLALCDHAVDEYAAAA
jgi:hypothetical protein